MSEGDAPDADETYPWEHAEVLPEDRAMGLELELIELQHERAEAVAEGARTDPIEAEIHEVIDELEEVEEAVAQVSDAPSDSPVEIHAPEAAEIIAQQPPGKDGTA